MADYCGTPEHIEIQKRMLARQDWIATTPSVANGGRVLNVVDPDGFGWDRIRECLTQDHLIACVAQDKDTFLPRLKAALGDAYDYPVWQVYAGSAQAVSAACRQLLEQIALPDGWHIDTVLHPGADQIAQVQNLNIATGVAPYPAFYSAGNVIGCATTLLWSKTGDLVASASVADKFHPEGRLGGSVFKGSTCVLPVCRGRSLGKLVNAHNLLCSLAAFGWTQVISQVQPGNVASQKTIGTCGLAPQEGTVTVGVLPKGAVFTR